MTNRNPNREIRESPAFMRGEDVNRFFQVEDGTHASRHRDGRNMFLFLAGLTVGVSAITFDECLSEAVTSKACILQGIQCFLLQVDFLGHD